MYERTKSLSRIDSIRSRNRRCLIVLVTLVLTIALANVATAQEHPCGGDIDTVRVTYVNQVTNSLDSRTNPGATTPRVKLQGSLHYKTPEPGTVLKNRPILIFSHGHERGRGEACEIVKFFTDKNWVVFAPLRRGHFLDLTGDEDGNDEEDLRSTGIYIDDFVDACSRFQGKAESEDYLTHLYCGSGFCRAGLACDATYFRSGIELDYLSQQKIDVRDAIAFIKLYPAIGATETAKRTPKLVDPDRIVILGHSYGGGLTVFANTEDYGQSVAIDISGAELSWDNTADRYWKWDLELAMFFQQRPIYFLQPKNGKYLGPTKSLFGIAVDQQYRSQAAIFPPAACDARGAMGEETFPPCDETDATEFKQIHSTFVGHTEQVAKWGPSVIEFANRYQKKQ